MEIPTGLNTPIYKPTSLENDANNKSVQATNTPTPLSNPQNKQMDTAQHSLLASASPFFPLFASAEAKSELATTPNGNKIVLGKSLGEFSSETDALRFAQKQARPPLASDLAIIRSPNQRYQVQTLEIPGYFLSDQKNLKSYEDIRSLQLSPALEESHNLIAIAADNGSTRFVSGQSSPIHGIKAPPNPASISPANLPNEQRMQRVQDLRQKTVQTLACIRDMAHKLGVQKDHRGIFANVYSAIIARGLKELDQMIAKGDLRAAEFCGSLYINFANRYYQAFEAYQNGNMDHVPEAWREAFDAGRIAQSQSYGLASSSKILGLSMIAHILNDLPQTLQDIGYPQAEDRDYLEGVFNEFNSHMMDEKTNIMANIETYFGDTDIKSLDQLGNRISAWFPGPLMNLNNATQTSIFTGMRNIAKQSAIKNLSAKEIAEQVKPYSRWVRSMPGGGK